MATICTSIMMSDPRARAPSPSFIGLITSFCLLVDVVRPFHIFKEFLLRYWSFVMGTRLIQADGEIWRVRRRVIAPALHQKYVNAMIGLLGEASQRLCLQDKRIYIKWQTTRAPYL